MLTLLLWIKDLYSSGLGGDTKVALLVSGNAGGQTVEGNFDELEIGDTLKDGGLVNDRGRIPNEHTDFLKVNTSENRVMGANARPFLVTVPFESITNIYDAMGASTAQCGHFIELEPEHTFTFLSPTSE